MSDPALWSVDLFDQPCFRVAEASLQVRRPRLEVGFALFPLVPAGAAVAALVSVGAAWSAVVAVGGALTAAWCVRRAQRIRVLAERSGWHLGRRLVPWPEVERLVIFRGEEPRSDFIAITGGERITFAEVLPRPQRLGTGLRSETIDTVCHLQHDLAHQLGLEPIPVVVDLGRDEPRAAFVHPCPICDPPAPAD